MTQDKLGQSVESRSEVGQRSSRLAKTHEDYWKARLRRRNFRAADGSSREVPEWQVKLFRDRRQLWVNLETANKDAAARKARDLWMQLKINGWDAIKPRREQIVDPTVGEFLAAVRAEADLHPATFEIYAKKFRRLVVGTLGIESDRKKHDYATGGYDAWLARVESTKLSRINAEAVQRWKTRHLSGAAASPIGEKRARRTIASILRSSKALFAPRILQKLHITLPTPLPLAGVDLPRIAPSPYISRIEPIILFQQAQRELEAPTPELLRIDVLAREDELPPRKRFEDALTKERRIAKAIDQERIRRRQMFRVFCLGLFAGLRRDEIDTLIWRQLDFVGHTIRIETNEFTRAKSSGSEVSVDIDPSFSEMLRAWMQASSSAFVIEINNAPRPEISTYHHYRCDSYFKHLNRWLKAHGVDELKALHGLRKEFGTQINRTHGLFAASSALRHSSIQLTKSVYIAKKDRAVFSLPASNPTTQEVAQ